MKKRVLVCVRPRGAGPSWWPIDTSRTVNKDLDRIVDGAKGPFVGDVYEYKWHTVNESGGFKAGFDPRYAVEGDDAIGERIDAWFEAHENDPWPWEIRAVWLND